MIGSLSCVRVGTCESSVCDVEHEASFGLLFLLAHAAGRGGGGGRRRALFAAVSVLQFGGLLWLWSLFVVLQIYETNMSEGQKPNEMFRLKTTQVEKKSRYLSLHLVEWCPSFLSFLP